MTLQEIDRPGDMLLKDGSVVSVEHRNVSEIPSCLWNLQALLKNQSALDYAKTDDFLKSIGSHKICMIVTGEKIPRKSIAFLNKHNITFEGKNEKAKRKFIDSLKNDLKISQKELEKLIKENAELLIQVVGRDKIKLDYSIKSLEKLDMWILSKQKQLTDSLARFDIVVIAGCYLGEVVLRQRKTGKWILGPALGSIAVHLDINGNKFNPMGKVMKLISNGEEDSLLFMAKTVLEYTK